ncbi:lysophospholipid acyltransferase family protein [Dissulfurirhabdus thermomarina]|uniref:Lysophospholipid acyltransferase family protein n=1 Tax=Dissulfurirhabdus thermomarina TaxID=1765737 RepID=A0A6N9TMU2_DISTH|nr:lysophospholipid acyltransferase family protein [Dissulfurirhabdus thermomarina]NDY41393.1 lysophospholipid acyltransferase family protein [Dissulfurirhabdus thermomarina]NMX23591.1 lysophospholipid acyltransferase family protein [Dissulfurirhabdus thermomarina]
MILPRKFYLLLFYVFARTTPRFWQVWQNRAVSKLFFLAWGRMRRIVQGNLAVVLGLPPDAPRVRRLARNVFRNYGLYLVDYVRISWITPRTLPRVIAEEAGTAHIRAALDRGRGAILVTPHLGHWELGGLSLAFRGLSVTALTLTDHESRVQEYRDRVRGRLGIETVHIAPDDPGTVLKLARLLRENKVVVMLGDRWEGGKRVPVTFFGRRTFFPAGAAALALATGAPIIPVFVVLRPDNRYRAWMETPVEVVRRPNQRGEAVLAEKTQELAAAFERVIARHPDQWYHFFDYWSRYGCEDPAARPTP